MAERPNGSMPARVESTDAESCDVLVVGAGPVGLLLAGLLGQAGHTVCVLEARDEPPPATMAIGITPPSLEILSRLGLHPDCIRAGVCVQEAFVHENRREIGHLDFRLLQDRFPFVLSLPQHVTLGLLAGKLATFRNLQLHRGRRVVGMEQLSNAVRVMAVGGDERVYRARLVAVCDGARGELAAHLGIGAAQFQYAPTFTMFDVPDRSGLGEEAHLFFGPERPVESFPLPDARRRWVVRTGWGEQPDLEEPLPTAIRRLTGFSIEEDEVQAPSRFRPWWKLARRFFRGRVALCGDASHVMSPIGGQGMNVGFGDAAHLAFAFHQILDHEAPPHEVLSAYERTRRAIFRRASFRTALGMRLGVMHGCTGSRLRTLLLRQALHRKSSTTFLLRWLTMRHLPAPVAQIPVVNRG